MTYHMALPIKAGLFRIYVKVILFLFIVYPQLTINLYPLFSALLTLKTNREENMILF